MVWLVFLYINDEANRYEPETLSSDRVGDNPSRYLYRLSDREWESFSAISRDVADTVFIQITKGFKRMWMALLLAGKDVCNIVILARNSTSDPRWRDEWLRLI